jgi:hypothetical protein
MILSTLRYGFLRFPDIHRSRAYTTRHTRHQVSFDAKSLSERVGAEPVIDGRAPGTGLDLPRLLDSAEWTRLLARRWRGFCHFRTDLLEDARGWGWLRPSWTLSNHLEPPGSNPRNLDPSGCGDGRVVEPATGWWGLVDAKAPPSYAPSTRIGPRIHPHLPCVEREVVQMVGGDELSTVEGDPSPLHPHGRKVHVCDACGHRAGDTSVVTGGPVPIPRPIVVPQLDLVILGRHGVRLSGWSPRGGVVEHRSLGLAPTRWGRWGLPEGRNRRSERLCGLELVATRRRHEETRIDLGEVGRVLQGAERRGEVFVARGVTAPLLCQEDTEVTVVTVTSPGDVCLYVERLSAGAAAVNRVWHTSTTLPNGAHLRPAH